MKSTFRQLSFKIVPVFFTALILIPAYGNTEESQTLDRERVEARNALEGISPNMAFQTNAPGGYVKPRLPENVVASDKPVVMPLNEKIRILPLNTLKVPVAAVLAKPVQSTVFDSPHIVKPAVSAVQTVASPAPALAQKKQS